MILKRDTMGASKANETKNAKKYDATNCPRKIITVTMLPRWRGLSILITMTLMTIGWIRYAQYVTRLNGYREVADSILFTTPIKKITIFKTIVFLKGL